MILIVCVLLAIMIEKAWSAGRAKVGEQWANAGQRIAKGEQSTEWGRRAATVARGVGHAARGTGHVMRGVGAVLGATAGGVVAGYRAGRAYIAATRAAGTRPTVAGARAHARAADNPQTAPDSSQTTSGPPPGRQDDPRHGPTTHDPERPDDRRSTQTGPAAEPTPAPAPAPAADPYADAVTVEATDIIPVAAIAAVPAQRKGNPMSVYEQAKAEANEAMSLARAAAHHANSSYIHASEMQLPHAIRASLVEAVNSLTTGESLLSAVLATLAANHDTKAEVLSGQASGTADGYGASVG